MTIQAIYNLEKPCRKQNYILSVTILSDKIRMSNFATNIPIIRTRSIYEKYGKAWFEYSLKAQLLTQIESRFPISINKIKRTNKDTFEITIYPPFPPAIIFKHPHTYDNYSKHTIKLSFAPKTITVFATNEAHAIRKAKGALNYFPASTYLISALPQKVVSLQNDTSDQTNKIA